MEEKSGWAKIEICIIFISKTIQEYDSEVFVSYVILIRKLKVCKMMFGSSHAIVAIFALFAIYATLQDLSVLAGPTIKC